MSHKVLVKTDELVYEDQTIGVRYYEWRTFKGAKRFTAQLLVSLTDRPTFDHGSLEDLEARVGSVFHAVMESRELFQAA